MPTIDFEPVSSTTSKVDFEPLSGSSKIDFEPIAPPEPPSTTSASDKALSETPVSSATASDQDKPILTKAGLLNPRTHQISTGMSEQPQAIFTSDQPLIPSEVFPAYWVGRGERALGEKIGGPVGTTLKALGGVSQGVGEATSGFTTPQNIGLLATTPFFPEGAIGKVLGTALGGAFEAQQIIHDPEQFKQLKSAWNNGDYGEVARLGSQMFASHALPAMAPFAAAKLGGEVNASEITGSKGVPEPEVRTQLGEETPLRQQGEVAGTQEPIVAEPPQEETQPVGLTETLAELKRRNGVAPGEVALPESPLASTAAETTAPALNVPESTDAGAAPQPGVANKYLDEVYGDASPAVVAGKGPKEWKALGQARLNDFQQTGNPINDPYAVLTKLREGGVPVAKIPHDVSLLRAEHQRLVEDARQSEGSPQYPEKAQAAFNMATAIKQVAHGPASDVFRSLQEHDAPRYDNLTDFDQAIRERMKRESTPEEKQGFQKIATDVRTKGDAAGKEVDIAQRQVRQYRPKEKMSLEDAAKSIHDQLAELTKDCVL